MKVQSEKLRIMYDRDVVLRIVTAHRKTGTKSTYGEERVQDDRARGKGNSGVPREAGISDMVYQSSHGDCPLVERAAASSIRLSLVSQCSLLNVTDIDRERLAGTGQTTHTRSRGVTVPYFDTRRTTTRIL